MSGSASTSGAQAPAPTATGDHPYQQKNAIAISEMGPVSTTYARARQKVTPYAKSRGAGVPVYNLGREVSDDRAMPPLREEPGAGGVHASMRSAADARAEGEGGDGKSCDEKSSAPCDENSVGDLKPHASPSAKARQRSAFRRQTAIAAPPAHARDPAR